MMGDHELAHKHARLIEILDREDAPAIVLDQHPSLAWLLGGARVHVSLAAPPIVSAVVDRAHVSVFVTQNEADRLRAEELPPSVRVSVREWHEPVAAAPDGALREHDVEAQLRAARRVLLPVEVERYRRLGTDLALSLGSTARGLDPADTERDAAAALAGSLVACGADPVVVLVAGASRTPHRHPLPTSAPIGRRAMLVACARRDGLIANATRWVRFGAAPAAEEDAERRLLEVEADGFAALQDGSSMDAAFHHIRAAYPRHGFAADEWRRHHQGGPAGYAGRDPRFGAANDPIQTGQAFAINPSAPGVKVEDTVLLTAAGIDVLTAEPTWPTALIRGIRRPVTLEL